jgi:hypothetical protein
MKNAGLVRQGMRHFQETFQILGYPSIHPAQPPAHGNT